MLVFGDFDLWPDVHLRNCQNYRTYVSVSTGEPILEVKNVLDMFHSRDYFNVILLGLSFSAKFGFFALDIIGFIISYKMVLKSSRYNSLGHLPQTKFLDRSSV